MVQKEIIADSIIELEAKISKYMTEFHPAGYGTTIKTEPYESNGKWYCLMERLKSCD